MDDDPLEGSSGLFESVLGEPTESQWEQYKLHRKLTAGYVVDSDSDGDNFYVDSRSCSPVMHIELVHPDEPEKVVQVAKKKETKTRTVPKVSWSSDAAVRYVNGEINFAELSEVMEDTSAKSPKPRKRKAHEALKDDDGDAGENQESGDDKDETSKPEKKQKKTRRKLYELPKELQGLMGSANLSFAKGDAAEGIKICEELIRQAPLCQEPYQTLGMIYEETGDMEKSLEYCLLAAYLKPSDTEEWIRLAGLSQDQQQIRQAIRCYSFAIRNEPTNIGFIWERCNLYELAGDRKNALAGYELILQNLSRPEDGEKCVEIAREIAKVHHTNEDFVNAIKVLETAFLKFPNMITSEDVNLLLELQINQKSYKSALKNYIQHCGVSLIVNDKEVTSFEEVDSFDDELLKGIEKCSVPAVLPVDIQVKLLICLIHLGSMKATESLMAALKQESPDVVGDLYLDVAEAFMEMNEPSLAEPLLKDLISSEKYNLAAVWLKYGDCLNMLLRGTEASKAYETVLKMAPSYQEARVSLSRIFVEAGRKLEAATVLKQEYEDGKEDAVIDLQVLVERCQLLYELEHFQDFILSATITHYSHCYKLVTHEECIVTIHNQHNRKRFEVLKDMPSVAERPRPTFINVDVSPEKMWDIFMKLCRKLFEFKRFQELQNVGLDAITSTLWKKSPEYSKDINLLVLLACMYNKSHKFSYSLLRDLITKDVHNNKLWNLLCLSATDSQQIRHHRFCLRLMLKSPDNLALGLFNGHNAMNAGNYKHALAEYVYLLKKRPNDPELLFYIGITYIHMASQKFSTKRYFLIAQGLAFLQQYMEARKDSQEALYNMGRAMQQLGIKDAAVVYYKRALDAPPVVSSAEEKETFDLTGEIVFNLALIYQSCGSNDLARMYLRTYNIV